MRIIATALETIETASLIDFLTRYFSTHEVSTIVVGHPHPDNPEGVSHSATLIAHTVKKLKKNFPGKRIDIEDESFTSRQAATTLAIAGYKRKDRRNKANLDKISAVLILQRYLERI